jgi:hypothetical protein
VEIAQQPAAMRRGMQAQASKQALRNITTDLINQPLNSRVAYDNMQ